MSKHRNAQSWYAELQDIAAKHNNKSAVQDFDGWTFDWDTQSPADAYYSEYPEHKDKP